MFALSRENISGIPATSHFIPGVPTDALTPPHLRSGAWVQQSAAIAILVRKCDGAMGQNPGSLPKRHGSIIRTRKAIRDVLGS